MATMAAGMKMLEVLKASTMATTKIMLPKAQTVLMVNTGGDTCRNCGQGKA